MLILTRRCGESIKIGASITFTVLSTKGDHVRVGVEAPREVVIDREEIYGNQWDGRPHPVTASMCHSGSAEQPPEPE